MRVRDEIRFGSDEQVMRFDELVRPGMIVREIKQKHPDTVDVFEKYGFRGSCDDCTIEQVSRKYGLNSLDVTGELNQAILDRAS
jgi:hypothetical protein